MAIRVLGRLPLRRILPQIPTSPPPKLRPFSSPPNPRKETPPRCSSNSQFTHQIAIAGLLRRYGFPQSQLHEFIQKNRFLLNSNTSDIEKCIGSLLSFGLTQSSLLSILLSCPRALEPGFLVQWQLAISELGASTASKSIICTVLEQCGKLRIEPGDFSANVKKMKEFGFTDETVVKVFEELPAAFMKNPIDVGRRIEFLKGVGLESNEIDRVCNVYPELLAFGVEGRLWPLFEEFWDLGFDRSEVKKALCAGPKLVLGMEVGELSRCVELVRSLKCRIPIKEKIVSKGYFRAGIEAKLRVDFLCSHGLIRRDAFKVLFIEPRCILYELEDIKEKVEFLSEKLGFSIQHLVEFPEFLGMNLEKQIVPRYNVIEHLRPKGALGFKVELKHLTRLSRLKFYNLFVKPYPECETIFGGLVRERELKPRHPPGLWKLFTPQKYPDSKEDEKNIRHFMESLV